MKRLFFVLFVIGNALIVSCDNKPDPEKPFPIGSWRTTNHYYDRAVVRAEPEELGAIRELETDVDVVEAEEYRLTFNENRTGEGSGKRPDGPGRYDFGFTWQLSGDKLTVTETEPKSGGLLFYSLIAWYEMNWGTITTVEDVVFKERLHAEEEVEWNIEESSADKMVLSTGMGVEYISSPGPSLAETYRYTFEKVK